jgi:hypothetical protein
MAGAGRVERAAASARPASTLPRGVRRPRRTTRRDLLSDRTFVIDAVAHAFNLTKGNFAHRDHAGAVMEPVTFGYEQQKRHAARRSDGGA